MILSKKKNVIACALLLLAIHAAAQSEKPFPSRAEILALMHRVDDYQVANPVMPPMDRNWERGTWYTGVMEAWIATHDQSFFNQALNWGKLNDWQIGTERLGANRLFCSETWTELYLVQQDPEMIAPTEKSLLTADPNSPAGAKRWYLDGEKPYIDSLYGASVFPMLALATGRRQYLATMHSFFDDVSGALWDNDAGLYYRDPTYIGKRTANGKKILWSRGNGWAFAGIVRILEYLPRNDPEEKKLLAIYKRMAAELIKRQSPDGFWRANLDDPDDVPNPESSGTGFFCFGLAWGIDHHILNEKIYWPATKRAYAALAGAVGPDGRVGWGQQVDARPNPAGQQSTHEYVTGAFLLASGEVYKLSK
jgi:unsaturated rhamnogalacturonyl hydrolase